MAAKKTVAKKAPAKKAPAKKAPAKKAPAKKAVAKKVPAKKAPAKKATGKTVVSQEQFCAMVSEAAYFAAQNDGNRKDAVAYWMDAEAALRDRFDVR